MPRREPLSGSVAELAEDTRSAGYPVAYSEHNALPPTSEAVAVTLYRIAQEALTNAMKHSPGADVEMTMTGIDRLIELRVTNTAPQHGRRYPGARPARNGRPRRSARRQLLCRHCRWTLRGRRSSRRSCRAHPVSSDPIRVVLVDDQALVRDAFARVVTVQSDMELVGTGRNGRDAVDLAKSLDPDVMVLDIRMPVLDGIEATRKILGAASEPAAGHGDGRPRILIVTTFNLDEYVFDALRAGASGFLLKDSPPRQLLDAIRTVAQGDALVDPAVTRTLIGSFANRIRPPAENSAMTQQLTPRELDVLNLLAKGMSNVEIASALVVTRETVKTYVSRILLKLGPPRPSASGGLRLPKRHRGRVTHCHPLGDPLSHVGLYRR